eukprot:6177751-Pleurochrysis_carterae.AAC.2
MPLLSRGAIVRHICLQKDLRTGTALVPSETVVQPEGDGGGTRRSAGIPVQNALGRNRLRGERAIVAVSARVLVRALECSVRLAACSSQRAACTHSGLGLLCLLEQDNEARLSEVGVRDASRKTTDVVGERRVVAQIVRVAERAVEALGLKRRVGGAYELVLLVDAAAQVGLQSARVRPRVPAQPWPATRARRERLSREE